jgi:hypothetical protein
MAPPEAKKFGSAVGALRTDIGSYSGGHSFKEGLARHLKRPEEYSYARVK